LKNRIIIKDFREINGILKGLWFFRNINPIVISGRIKGPVMVHRRNYPYRVNVELLILNLLYQNSN